MPKKIVIASAIFAAIAVIMGAFAAHALADVLNTAQHKTFETAVRYQMYHALAIGLCASLYYQKPSKILHNAAILFGVGIVLFSGSLYSLIFLNLFNIEGFKFIGAITPIGGIAFILGWLMMIRAVLKW